MAQEVTTESSRGAMALRELEQNYFCLSINKWLKTAEIVFDDSNKFQPSETGAENMKERFISIISSIMPEGADELRNEAVRIFADEMKEAEKDIACRIKKYIPTMWHKDLMPQNLHNGDPLRVLSHLKGAGDGLAGINEFEFVRAMELAVQYFFISITQNRFGANHKNDNGDFEKLVDFMRWLKIDAQVEEKEIIFHLDENDGWRCRIFTKPPKKRERAGLKVLAKKVNWVVIKTRLHSHRQKIEAIVQARKKDHMEMFARRFRDPQIEMLTDVPDIHGVRFAYFSNRYLNRGTAFIAQNQVHHDCRVRRIHLANKHASKNIKLKSQNVYLNGTVREIQHVLARDLVNILHSSCSENHALYHLRWYTEAEGLFSQLFPKNLYGIDWEDPEVRLACQKHIIDRIDRENRKLPPA